MKFIGLTLINDTPDPVTGEKPTTIADPPWPAPARETFRRKAFR